MIWGGYFQRPLTFYTAIRTKILTFVPQRTFLDFSVRVAWSAFLYQVEADVIASDSLLRDLLEGGVLLVQIPFCNGGLVQLSASILEGGGSGAQQFLFATNLTGYVILRTRRHLLVDLT